MSITVRNGKRIEDPRLGRVYAPDPGDHRYSVAGMWGTLAPHELRSYTWSVGHWFDQGSTPQCVEFSWRHEAVARPVKVPADKLPMRGEIYKYAQAHDEWPGSDYDGTSVRAGAKAMQAYGFIGNYWWCRTEPEVAQVLGYKGPVVVGTNWHADMFEPDDDGFIRPTGRVEGGHAYLIYALSIKQGWYGIWNSWGSWWGLGGTAKIRRNDLAALLEADGEACVPTERRLGAQAG